MITKIANEFLKEAALPGWMTWLPGVKNIRNAFTAGRNARLANSMVEGAQAGKTQAQLMTDIGKPFAGDSVARNQLANRFANNVTSAGGIDKMTNFANNAAGIAWKQGLIGAGKLGLTGGALYGGGKLLFGGNPAPAAPQMQRAAY